MVQHPRSKKGFTVKGTSTSPEKANRLSKEGLRAFQLVFIPLPVGDDESLFFDTDLLVITIPPSSRTSGGGFYLEKINAIKEGVEKAQINKIIYISSTSVYPSLIQYVYSINAKYLHFDPPMYFETPAISPWKKYLQKKSYKRVFILILMILLLSLTISMRVLIIYFYPMAHSLFALGGNEMISKNMLIIE